MSNVQTAVTAIRNMNSDELNQVIEAIKLQRTFLSRMTASTLRIGDTVEFDGRGGRTVQGVVEKINRKTVVVNSMQHGRWKVAANMLRQVDVA